MSCAAAVVGTPVTKKRKRDESQDDVDEAFDPGDDSDLGLGPDSDENAESIGLDTSTGFEENGDDFELAENDEDEDERWSSDSEEANDLVDTEGDQFPGEEYGWIGDDEPSDDDESFDAGIGDEEAETRDDGGAEGVEDDSELDDINLSDLPALDSDGDDDVGQANGDGQELDELGGMNLIDEPSIEIATGELWKMLPARAVRVTQIVAPAAPMTRLITQRQTLYVCADKLYRLAAGEDTLQTLPLSAATPQHVAVGEYEGDEQLAVLVGGRLHVSRDAGQTFELLDVAGITQASYTRSASGLRLWWRTTRGTLGGDWTAGPALPSELDADVLAFHADGKRSLAVLAKQRGRTVLLYSGDAGKRFARHPVPAAALTADLALSFQTCAGAVLLVTGDEVRCAWLPESFAPVAMLARAPAALSEEEDEPFVYACVPRGDEWLVIRRAARAVRAAPLVLCALGKDVLRQPQQLAVGYAEGGAVSIYVAAQDVLLRIDASLDSEEPT